MAAFGKLGPMYGLHGAGLQVVGGLCGLGGTHVGMRPVGAVLPAFYQGQIERAVLCADAFEMMAVTAVAAVKQLVVAGFNYVRCPQRFIALQRAIRAVPGRGGRNVKSIGKRVALVPVEFYDLAGLVAPIPQVRTHTHRYDHFFNLLAQLFERAVIHVVIMIVRYNHHINRRHIINPVMRGPFKSLYQTRHRACIAAKNRVD